MDTDSGHIMTTPGVAGGKPRIAGHRITVQDIVLWHERLDVRADKIATEFGLSLADVYAALAYYYDHREEIDRSIVEDEAFVAELRRSIPSATERGPVAEPIRNQTDELEPRAAEAVMAVEVFEDDDPGFLGWRDSHPRGYVVNAYRNPTPEYLMLHRTSCPHLHRPVAAGRWTKDFVKVCATDTDDLAAWAQLTVTDSARLKPCHWCKPYG